MPTREPRQPIVSVSAQVAVLAAAQREQVVEARQAAPRDDVDDAAQRVRPVEGRARAAHHLDALDGGHVEVLEVEVAVGVLADHAPAVDEQRARPSWGCR